ncbi:uncharacterized protein (DUF885 family) [Kibdelosporangium banguiense]|uniref:Uncharacterized protein (DUF885 family) n=1 Tax=Kibdelosporangium banguiense TaxID=1365924 RepID=A0ABS4TAY5_9PSEU|nr:DUF885 domain-containing protein [Kibdelosporangium banguiense]MBP2321567.1 uncharacterized protein (DUF885 family) [Kibdelosporangium banguiense]
MTITSSQPDALADELMRMGFDREPVSATLYGIPGYDALIGDPSAAADEAARAQALDVIERAGTVDRSGLSEQDAITLAVVSQQARSTVDRIESKMAEYTITDLFIGAASGLLTMLPMTALANDDRAQDYLTRLRAVPGYLAATAERHREGVAAGRVPVEHLVNGAIAHLDRYLADPQADALRRPQPPQDAESFVAERDRLLEEVVRPAFGAYRDTLANEIVQHARSAGKVGLTWLPDGDELYQRLSRVHTTTDRTAEDLHQTGLDLIASLSEEFAEVGSRVFGTSNVQEIFDRLRNDPALRWNSEEELLSAAREAIERAEAEAPRWFGHTPSHSCKVEPVPAAEAPGAPMAYYMPPALDGSRAGTYFANTYQPGERHRHVAEVTAFHEAVPGHHFQLTIAGEQTDLPLLRRLADVNAYTEGWGLYCERLAEEMGLYSGDIARLGMLSMDAVRAGRLVVDTGMHAKGWSRGQAVDYMAEHVPMPALEINTEVDRYIAYPGQALSYMVGRLEIQRIRAAAQQTLGDRFDIRTFHDLVIGSGPLPLTVLDQVVTDWASR